MRNPNKDGDRMSTSNTEVPPAATAACGGITLRTARLLQSANQQRTEKISDALDRFEQAVLVLGGDHPATKAAAGEVVAIVQIADLMYERGVEAALLHLGGGD